MSKWLVAATGLAYPYVAAEQAWLRNIPMAAVYFGYALANVGLYVAVQ